MNFIKKLFVTGLLFACFVSARAQVEVVRLQSKDFSATGFGGFLNISVPVNETNAAIVEGAVYYLANSSTDTHEAVAPVLLGYRHLLGQNDYGFYVEPVAGYSFGATDIQKTGADGGALYKPNGDPLSQSVTGPTGGIGFGYLFQESGPIRFNISIRYEHTFVNSGDPALNIISLRISHSFSF